MVISVSVVYHVTGICHKKLSKLHKSLTSTHFMWTNTWRGVWRSTKSRLSALSCELSNINESVSVVLISFSTWEEQPPSTRPRSNSDHLGQPRNASLPSDYNVVDLVGKIPIHVHVDIFTWVQFGKQLKSAMQ